MMGIFIAVLMVGSILGVMTYSQPPQDSSPPPVTNNTPTKITYSASGVEGKVLQVFPTAVLLANTTEVSAGDAEAKIRSVPGVVGVSNGMFVQGQETNFRADLRVDSAGNFDEIAQKLGALGAIKDVTLYPQALVSVPQEVELKNEQSGLAQKQSFANSQVQAFVSMGTRTGDSIKISIQAEFSGQTLSNVLAIEESNPSTAQQIYFTDGNFTISSMESEFFIKSFADYSGNAKLESLSQLLRGQDENAQLQIADATGDTTVYFAQPNTIFPQDLNTFFTGFSGIKSFEINSGPAQDVNFASVAFDGDVDDYNAFKSSLVAGLNSLGFNVSVVKEPQRVLQAQLIAGSGDSLLGQVTSFSLANSLDSTVLQKAIIDANSVFIADANASFALKEGSFDAFVNTSRKAGDSVLLSLFIVGSPRAGIEQINAQEAGK